MGKAFFKFRDHRSRTAEAIIKNFLSSSFLSHFLSPDRIALISISISSNVKLFQFAVYGSAR